MISVTFIKLKKNCKIQNDEFIKCKLAIMGDCATQHLSTAIKGYGVEEQINFDIFDADYNQIDAQVIDEESELYKFEPQFVIIYMCVEKLYDTFCKSENRYKFSDDIYQKIVKYWHTINSRIKTNIIHFTFAEVDDRCFGNYAQKTRASFLYQVKHLNYLIMEGCQEIKNVFLMDLNYIQSEYGREKLHDNKLYYVAKMPLSLEILPEVAKQSVDIIESILGKFKKCVILDLDNTLWGGVIGDDGIDGIQIGELGQGHAFEELQRWIKELKNRGIILAICSKNNEDTAKEPFEKHPEMVLRLDDISMFVANWEDKATNIKKIQKDLNIGMDSIVFIDDNPFERNLVKSIIPEITVPELPEDPADYLPYLKSLNLFETSSYSDEDKDRTNKYQAEIGRRNLQKEYQTFDEYLKSLDMVAEVKPFDKFQFPRIAQLTQRSNQFNLRTIRCTESEIEDISKDDKYITLYFTLRDKFGDHGLISLVILEKKDKNTLFMYNWLMSCRVLKRGMEEFIINTVIETARNKGFKKVIGEYIKTPKNQMVENIYQKLGFKSLDQDRFEADVDEFIKNKTYIKINKREEQ